MGGIKDKKFQFGEINPTIYQPKEIILEEDSFGNKRAFLLVESIKGMGVKKLDLSYAIDNQNVK